MLITGDLQNWQTSASVTYTSGKRLGAAGAHMQLADAQGHCVTQGTLPHAWMPAHCLSGRLTVCAVVPSAQSTLLPFHSLAILHSSVRPLSRPLLPLSCSRLPPLFQSHSSMVLHCECQPLAAPVASPRHWLSLMQLSHVPFLLASVLAYRCGWWPSSLILLALCCASLAYHHSGEQRWARLDSTLAHGVVLSNCVRLAYAWSHPSVALALLGFALHWGVCPCPANYERVHPWWHIVTAVGTMLLYV